MTEDKLSRGEKKETKICTKCGEAKPANTDHYYKNANYLDGLSYWCKACRKVMDKKYHNKNKESRCEYARKYHQENRDRKNAEAKKRSKEHYLRNREETLKRQKKYYHENKQAISKRTKDYRKKNKEKIGAYFKKYRQSERGKELGRLNCLKWKSLKKELTATFTVKQWKDCKEHFNNTCAYCGKPSKRLTKEHFIPVTKGGVFTVSNIIPACQFCNSSKNNNDFFEWYSSREYYSAAKEKKILKYLKIDSGGGQQVSVFDFQEMAR